MTPIEAPLTDKLVAASVAPAATSSGAATGSPSSPLLKQPAYDGDGDEPGKLFIGGLSQATTELSLRAHFSQFGQLESAVVMMDSQSGRSRGFGFVKFKELAGAAAALDWGKDNPQLDGKAVDVKQSNIRVRGSRAALMRHLKVFVGGIGPEVDAFSLRVHFSQYGRVVDVNLMLDAARQRHRGFAFITFEDERVVQRLVQLRFVSMGGRLVEVKAMKPPGSSSLAGLGRSSQQQQQFDLHSQLPNNNQHHFLMHHQQTASAHSMTAASRCVGGSVAAATMAPPSAALPLLASTVSAYGGCPSAAASAGTAAVSCWQPVAFDPGPGLAWATAAWSDQHQLHHHQPHQHQLHHHQLHHHQLHQHQLHHHQLHHHQHYPQHHLSILESTWLSQPLLAAATASWPSLLSLQPLRQHHSAQLSQQQQQPQQQQQQLRQDSDTASCRFSFSFTTSSSSASSKDIGTVELPHQPPQPQQHNQHHQQQQQQSQQQHQHHEQYEQNQLLMQARAGGDFDGQSI